MKLLKFIPILLLFLTSCEKETVTHQISYSAHSDSAGFEFVYLGSTTTHSVNSDDTSIVVYPFSNKSGNMLKVSVAANNIYSNVTAAILVDGVPLVVDSSAMQFQKSVYYTDTTLTDSIIITHAIIIEAQVP